MVTPAKHLRNPEGPFNLQSNQNFTGNLLEENHLPQPEIIEKDSLNGGEIEADLTLLPIVGRGILSNIEFSNGRSVYLQVSTPG